MLSLFLSPSSSPPGLTIQNPKPSPHIIHSLSSLDAITATPLNLNTYSFFTPKPSKNQNFSFKCRHSDYFEQQQQRFASKPPPRNDTPFAPQAGVASLPRVFVGHSIYKGKAALTVEPRPPEFSPLDSGAFKLSSPGYVLLQFAPAAGVRQYDWGRKQVFSLSVTEMGSLISLGARESCEFFHDPFKGKSDEGKVRKVLKVEPLPDGSGHFFNLSVQNKLLNLDESIYIPITKAEYTVLVSAFNFIVPHLLGWHTFASSIKPEDTIRVNNASPRSGTDFEWNSSQDSRIPFNLQCRSAQAILTSDKFKLQKHPQSSSHSSPKDSTQPSFQNPTIIGMAQLQTPKDSSKLAACDAYFETIQKRKKLPDPLQESLTAEFARIPVSSFPEVPGGQVIEILADTSIGEAVKILSESNILSAPVRDPDVGSSMDWRERYLGTIDYSAIVLWVLESAEIAAAALTATSATAAGLGAGVVGALGAVALGATGPAAIAGLTVAAVGAAVAGGAAADRGAGKDAPTAADKLGEDFYKVILHEEPFKSTTVRSILKSYRWAPFLPVSTDSSMLSVLLLLSKYRLRNVPVIEPGQPCVKNFITQSAVVHGLQRCKGRNWFDCISAHSLSDLGLPFMSSNEVISIHSNELILEAFKRMKDNQIGGLPVVEGPNRKIIGNLSIRDIRYLLLTSKLFANFRKLTVLDFMNSIAATSHDIGKLVTPITCKSNATIGTVIHTLASKSVHRIYVVGDEGEVVGVITLRDVISCFINEPPNHSENYFGFAVKEMLDQ
ncbi:hypothetical protein U1Q18_016922 [Sarracenia purpurea var. burkii]